MTDHLLLGTRDSRGRISPTPVIATIAPDGKVAAWHPLGACEPPATTPLRALLDLPTLTLLPL